MAEKNLFDVEELERRADALQEEQRWFELEGRVFGDTSPRPLKVLVTSGGDAWSRGWTRGCQEYARRLSPAARRRFHENAQSPLTIDSDALPQATRSAIRESGALLKVAFVGPILQSLEAPLGKDLAAAYGIDKLPADVAALYVRQPDGTYKIPAQTAPPAIWTATSDQVFRLLKYPDFVNQVANARRLLVDEELEDEEDALGNSGGGSGTPGPGPTSTRATGSTSNTLRTGPTKTEDPST